MLDLICFILFALYIICLLPGSLLTRFAPIGQFHYFLVHISPPSPSDANLATRAKLSHWVLVLAGLHSHVFFNNVRGACLRFLLYLTVCYMYDPEFLESKVLLWRYGLGCEFVSCTMCT